MPLIGGTDVRAVLHPNQMCHHIDADTAAIGTAPYQLPQHHRTLYLRAPHLHLIVDAAIRVVSATAIHIIL
jgi:hypothetical protein